MAAIDIALNWVHVICAVVFLGTMFVGTFVLMPVLKAHLDQDTRQRFIAKFIPTVRRYVRVFVALLVVSGIARAALLHFTHEGPASIERLSVFGLKILFAAVPVAIFITAPKILGRRSKAGLCCDPDAEDPPFLLGITSSTSTALHYAAISGGWIAVLLGIILGHMH